MPKNFVNNAKLITAGNAAGNLTSAAMDISTYDDIAVQVDVTGTPTGTVIVEASSNHVQDFMGNVTTPGTWATVNTQAIAAGSPSPAMINIQELAASYLRVRYTATSGTGTLTAVASAKGL